jgi:predicted porin
MKKLLLTTALAGATLVASNAIAQTTISGNLDISFKNLSKEGSVLGTQASQRGFGKEAQLNIQNKGKLNNGMDYAAGFSIEDDGNQTTTLFNENTFIDFISGNTTITIGQDHIQNNEASLATFIGLVAEDLTSSENTTQFATDGFLSAVGANPHEAFGIGIMQKTPVGTLSAYYVPKNGDAVGTDDTAGDSADESAWELGFKGDLGVKGLSIHAFINEEAKAGADTRKNKGQSFGASYNMGQITAGIHYKETEFGTTNQAVSVTKNTTEQIEYGLAYAATPNLTLAANYTKAESKESSGTPADAKSKSIAVGYNLGPVALTAQAARLENFNFVANTDADVLYLRASTKF